MHDADDMQDTIDETRVLEYQFVPRATTPWVWCWSHRGVKGPNESERSTREVSIDSFEENQAFLLELVQVFTKGYLRVCVCVCMCVCVCVYYWKVTVVWCLRHMLSALIGVWHICC